MNEARDHTVACKVCSSAMREAYRDEILGRHEAIYDHCEACGFMAVRDPHWLDEAYSDVIARSDTGIVARNIDIAGRLVTLCPALSEKPGPYLDFGGGTGLLVRLMRDRGFDFYWSDAYATNELARGFEYEAGRGPCIAVTAFEVLEHVTDPVAFVREALDAGGADTLIFTTVLYEGETPPRDWWYFSRSTGQHIGFFRRSTLEALGERLGLRLVSDGHMHVLTGSQVPAADILKSQGRLRRALAARRRGQSLTAADHEAMVARAAGGAELG